jgi:preprotein translocase subunit YajC
MQQDIYTTIGVVAIIIVVFWLMWIRPQKRERDRMKTMLDSVRKGDQVITAGGIYGRVLSVKPDMVVLKVDDNSDVKMRITRSSIVGIVKREEEEEESEEQETENKG